MFDEYDSYDATGLAGLVAAGDVSAIELLDTAIERIERLNPTLNCIVATRYEAARQDTTNHVTGPLNGVPYLVKDLHTYVAGMASVNGCRGMQDFCPATDATLITRLRRAGLNIAAKTNTPEFGLNIDTSPSVHGPTTNPLDPAKSAGGSSGGSACAVAAGIVPAAHATDSGGSIRIPASNCGLFGLKPSRSRVPLGNDAAEGLGGFSTAHAVTHSVRDSALLLDLTAGPLPGDPYGLTTPQTSFLAATTGKFRSPRVAVWTEGFAGEPVNEQNRRATIDAGQLCEELGCEVEQSRPPIDGEALRAAFDIVFTANMANAVAMVSALNPGDDIRNLVEPITALCAEAASEHGAADYASAIQVAQKAARAMGGFFGEFDVLLTPTLANPPAPLGWLDMQGSSWNDYLMRMLDAIPFTPLFNATGSPAASLPLGRDDQGMPIGVQIAAALGQESTLLALSAQIEAATPWHSRI